MQNEIERYKSLISLDAELQQVQDLDILLEKILLNTRRFVNADAGTIYEKKGNKLLFQFTQNDTKHKQLKSGEKLIYEYFTVDINKTSMSGYSALTKEILNISDVYHISSDAPYHFNPSYDQITSYKTKSALTFPLITNMGEVIGVIQVINAKDEKGNIIPFNSEDELFVKHFAANATIALQRAQLTRQIILRMISMAELRDPKETGPHVNRVAAYAVEIYEQWAKRRNLPQHELEKSRDILRMAAMLHDVGKVAISDVILKKPGNFTKEEYEIMKMHTVHGALLFRSKQSEFDDIAMQVALTHHENWDGTGYPGCFDLDMPSMSQKDPETGQAVLGKDCSNPVPRKGVEIPIFGRVVALADVFDALSSKRVYKEAWSEEDVLAEIRKLSGIKFDPELVEIFFMIYNQIKAISKKYPDEESIF
jgi:HD-GYP domain-containing protein (c-di-GMP phosphodiesterase class II)